jgi:hypothetical protein
MDRQETQQTQLRIRPVNASINYYFYAKKVKIKLSLSLFLRGNDQLYDNLIIFTIFLILF